MPWDNLRKRLNPDDEAFNKLPVNLPGTAGLDPSTSTSNFSGQILQKLMGDKATSDSVEPTMNPFLDLLPYDKIAMSGVSAARSLLPAAKSSIREAFDVANPSHLSTVQSALEKNVPAGIDSMYADGQIKSALLADPERQAAMLKDPDVQQAIKESGFGPASGMADDVAAALEPEQNDDEKFSVLKKRLSN
jgi:hypothetical protein